MGLVVFAVACEVVADDEGQRSEGERDGLLMRDSCRSINKRLVAWTIGSLHLSLNLMSDAEMIPPMSRRLLHCSTSDV